jgi:hypothetical protein
MLITIDMLVELDACRSQRELFLARFPNGCNTRTVWVADVIGFDIDWVVTYLLTPKQKSDYKVKRTPLYADYEAKRAPLDADYEAKLAPLYADYEAKLSLFLLEVINAL